MSNSFFASVRRNQKQWMVVVTVLSMVSFLFLDDFGRGKGPMSPFGGGMLIGCLVAAGMCIVGYSREKTAEFGIGGFVVGFIAGFVGFGSVGGNKPIVRTSIGNFSRVDFDHLANKRQKVNQFISLMAMKAQNPQAQGFGGIDDPAIVTYQMLLADARKMGIQITDDRVNEFLKQLSQGRLTRQDFKDSLRDARLGEGELFELLKSELSAQLVIELTEPPAYVPPIPPGFAQYMNPQDTLRYLQPSPLQLWTSFEKLNVKESLQAVAIPVRDFVSKVSEPLDSDLLVFFEKYKSRQWVNEARPGFVQTPRVQLAYLTADFEKFEKGADPTESEVSEFYEKNKERYRSPLAKESTAPKLPDGEAGDSKEGSKEDVKKEDKKEDEAKKSDEPAKDKEADKKVESDSKTEEKKPDEGGKQDQLLNNNQNDQVKEQDSGGTQKDEPQSNANDNAAEKPAAESKAEPAADKADADKPKPPALPSDAEAGKPAAEGGKDDPAVPKLNSSPESLPPAKFRELNDDLKLEIKEEILKERAFARMASELDKAKDFMDGLGLDYDSTTDLDKKKDKVKSIAERMKAYAETHYLEYKETPELAYEDLTSEPIGLAFEGKNRAPVVNEVFMQGPRGEPRIPLYSPHRADLKSQTAAFAYWKITELPAQFSDLKDEAVRSKVLSAWKFDQARSFAEKRAQELAQKVKTEGNDLPAALSSDTVTGDKNDSPVKVILTDPFTWLSASQSVPGERQGPTISAIPLIDNIDERFMKTVFEDLADGQAGVAVDEPHSIYYVVKVMNRETAHNDDGGVASQERQRKFMNEEFTHKFFPLMKSPYQTLAQIPQQAIDQGWRKNFEKKHQVDWEEDIGVSQSGRSRRGRK